MANMKLELNISTTGKPSLAYRIGEVTGEESKEQIESMRDLAWELYNSDREKILREYGRLKNDLGNK